MEVHVSFGALISPLSWLIDPGPEVHSFPVLQVNHESCSCIRVFNIEILGVSEGIWSATNLRLTDGERQYDRTRPTKPSLARQFSRFILYPQAQSVPRHGGQESRGRTAGSGKLKWFVNASKHMNRFWNILKSFFPSKSSKITVKKILPMIKCNHVYLLLCTVKELSIFILSFVLLCTFDYVCFTAGVTCYFAD